MFLGSLIPHSDYSQLLKLRELVDHYELHKLEAQVAGEEMSLYEFFHLHFIIGDEHEHHSSDHEDLPFQHFTSGMNLYIFSNDFNFEFSNTRPFRNVQFMTDFLFIDEEYLQTIFQPPAV